MIVEFDTSSVESYKLFVRVKALPSVRFVGRTAVVPDEYAHLLSPELPRPALPGYDPLPNLWDYQRDLAKVAISKQKFALFLDCGLGKTNIMLEYARYVSGNISPSRRVLIVTPLMVVPQFIDEVARFYGESHPGFTVEQVRANKLPSWICEPGQAVGITNYEALTDDVPQGRLGCLILDESGALKTTYGIHAQHCIRLGEGLNWKLCSTGTPAPNDRIEYANHAVFLDVVPTTNAYLSHYFVNKGKTTGRWELKGHAVDAFYRDMSHWAIWMSNPATYGWNDNCENIPPINIHIHDVELTSDQREVIRMKMGTLFTCNVGGIGSRSKISQIAKGNNNGKSIDTLKPKFIKDLVDSWPEESTIIWCLYNAEQKLLEKFFPRAASIDGSTSHARRMELIRDFQSERRKELLTKGAILGFGLNLQIATRQIFSGLVDSYEKFYQCVKRSNRYGSTKPLQVHIPITEAEAPMIDTVLRKARRIQEDTDIQEVIFRENSFYGAGK